MSKRTIKKHSTAGTATLNNKYFVFTNKADGTDFIGMIERRSDVPGSDETILHIRAEVMKNMPVQEETEEMRNARIKNSTRKTFVKQYVKGLFQPKRNTTKSKSRSNSSPMIGNLFGEDE
jgi:hypothetical protein